MSQAKNGRDFEALAEKFFSKLHEYKDFTITRNAQLDSADGQREIDVLLEGKLGPVEIRIIIECKAYKGIVDVTKVDALHSKMNDVRAHKAILIAYKGFSRTAQRKASRLGIELFTLSEALHEKWTPQKDIPILITELTPIFDISFEAYLNKGDSIDTRGVVINETDVFSSFFKTWNDFNFEARSYSSDELLSLLNINAPFHISEAGSKKNIQVSNLSLNLSYLESYYFGNLSSLPGTIILNKVTTNDKTLLIDTESILHYRTKLSKYTDRKDLPNNLAIDFNAVSRPELLNGALSFNISLKMQTPNEFAKHFQSMLFN